MFKNHFEQLDVFRALAACSVAAVHFELNSVFHNYLSSRVFVQLFFTLSGFVIFLNYYDNLANANNLLNFIKKRFKRLYPLHLFFLIIFLLIEFIKYYLLINYNFETNNKPFSTNNLKNFFLNLFFLQHFADVYNYNSPAWSISVEMMLYITLGLILLYSKKFMLPIFGVYIIVFLVFLNDYYADELSITAYLSGLYSFFLGCLFCYLFLKCKRVIKNLLFECFYLLFLVLFLFEFFYLKSIESLYYYSIFFGFIFFMSCFLDVNSKIYKVIFNKFFVFLGKISYSIYMSHLFIFWIIKFIMLSFFDVQMISINNKLLPDINYFYSNLLTVFIYAATFLFSSFTYKYIELKFYKK